LLSSMKNEFLLANYSLLFLYCCCSFPISIRKEVQMLNISLSQCQSLNQGKRN